MAKTYVPTLRTTLQTSYNYATRYQTLMAPFLTEPQRTCLSSLITALFDCLVLLGPEPIDP